eukprot:3197366-Amphidinium_carterae.1
MQGLPPLALLEAIKAKTGASCSDSWTGSVSTARESGTPSWVPLLGCLPREGPKPPNVNQNFQKMRKCANNSYYI